MKFDDLFEQQCLVASKLKNWMRNKGYTKVSFAKKTDISCLTLDKLLNGTIDNKVTFDKYFKKILSVLNLSVNNFLLLEYSQKSINVQENYQMNDNAKKQYHLLMDILELCEIYY